MFIGWISQMVALLDKPESKGVTEIVKAIAKEYPQVNTINTSDNVTEMNVSYSTMI